MLLMLFISIPLFSLYFGLGVLDDVFAGLYDWPCVACSIDTLDVSTMVLFFLLSFA